MKKPDFVFEVSWEVCNMVGGIHTVIQSKALQMRENFEDNYVCVGPHLQHSGTPPAFREEIWDDAIYKLAHDFSSHGVTFQMGRWLIPGEPKVLLIGFGELFHQKDRILSHYWEKFHLDSLFGGYDYLEPLLFSHASALLIEQIYNRIYFPRGTKVLIHAHEWLASIAILQVKTTVPEFATVFTTHATSLGRALCSRDSTLSITDNLRTHSVSEWVRITGVESKHSAEAIAAHEADIFTTVSEITSEECFHLLGKKADIITTNGLSAEVPSEKLLNSASKMANRKALLQIAESVTGFTYEDSSSYLITTSGRYEFRNKGIDLYLESLLELKSELTGNQRIIAFVMCPAAHGERIMPRSPQSFVSHQLKNEETDPVVTTLKKHHHLNSAENRVHIIFIPIYLNGLNSKVQLPHTNEIPQSYWELLSGVDLAVFPSWYEPWGYTPHEAISLGIPTITTDLTGFGLWTQTLPGDEKSKGVALVPRKDRDLKSCRNDLKNTLLKFFKLSHEEVRAWQKGALHTAVQARWKDFIHNYLIAYSQAMEKAENRIFQSPRSRFRMFSLGNFAAPSPFSLARANVRKYTINNRYQTLQDTLRQFMNHNLTWQWDPRIKQLFRGINPELWNSVGQKTIDFLQNIGPEVLRTINSSPDLQRLFKDIRTDFERTQSPNNFCQKAYFCMEYGITENLPIYSGGLGILAGDHLKTAADLKIPLAAFGLYYQYGYFKQTIDREGHQVAHFHPASTENLQLNLVQDDQGARLLMEIPLGEEQIFFQVWQLNMGTVNLYLLDANVIENPKHLRDITDRLYNTQPGRRISQEWLLSVGGLELIKKLKLPIQIFHMNEGHTAFLVVARVYHFMIEKNLTFDQALDLVRFSTIFTTHTPVPAGHDEFPMEEALHLLKKPYQEPELLKKFVNLGASLIGSGHDSKFSMTGLAIRGSRWINGVSKIHQGVSQQMFNNVFPDFEEQEVPITHVTNGVHIPYWLESDWQDLLYRTLGDEWPKCLTDLKYWRRLELLPLCEFRDTKLQLKQKLLDWLRGRVIHDLNHKGDRSELAAVLAKLNAKTLIITHAKRMAPYKRADLLFQDPDRLEELIKKSPVPLLFIYAGKAHPSDGLGQEALKRLSQWSKDPRFAGSILVIEDYDLSFSRTLISGSDIWLNTPLRPLEASGTSGMKAAINGTLHLSVADGWWPEAFNGKNGWMIGNGCEKWNKELQDSYDRNCIYQLLEFEVIPEFKKNESQIGSEDWSRRIRESIISTIPVISSERMFADYESRLYKPALEAVNELSHDDFKPLRSFDSQRKKLMELWPHVAFESIETNGLADVVHRKHNIEVKVELSHPGLEPKNLRMEAIIRKKGTQIETPDRHVHVLTLLPQSKLDRSYWNLRIENHNPGEYTLVIRVLGRGSEPLDKWGSEFKLVKWL